MSAAGATRTVFTVVPLMSRPMISPARSAASSGVEASFTPPALPRPPTRTWALTTDRAADALGCGARLLGRGGGLTEGERDAVAREDLLAPVLLELHAILLVRLRSPARALGWGCSRCGMDEDCSRVSPDAGVDGRPGEAETALAGARPSRATAVAALPHVGDYADPASAARRPRHPRHPGGPDADGLDCTPVRRRFDRPHEGVSRELRRHPDPRRRDRPRAVRGHQGTSSRPPASASNGTSRKRARRRSPGRERRCRTASSSRSGRTAWRSRDRSRLPSAPAFAR